MSYVDDVLNKRADEIERPKNPPAGPYFVKVTGPVRKNEIKAKASDDTWTAYDFPCQITGPTDVIDSDVLEDFGDVSQVRLNHRIMITDDTSRERDQQSGFFRLQNFIRVLEIGFERGEMTLGEALEQTKGGTFVGTLAFDPNPNDPDMPYMSFSKAIAVSDWDDE